MSEAATRLDHRLGLHTSRYHQHERETNDNASSSFAGRRYVPTSGGGSLEKGWRRRTFEHTTVRCDAARGALIRPYIMHLGCLDRERRGTRWRVWYDACVHAGDHDLARRAFTRPYIDDESCVSAAEGTTTDEGMARRGLYAKTSIARARYDPTTSNYKTPIPSKTRPPSLSPIAKECGKHADASSLDAMLERASGICVPGAAAAIAMPLVRRRSIPTSNATEASEERGEDEEERRAVRRSSRALDTYLQRWF
ncbi:hypothetical protein SCHPADRAFT_948034 [Schizopora paradoxa]|uniref:Uncharacterized protein n=1 Tax=Schizopora paradoxa TaxID=27342 RepID=A0A0H2QXG8_9AGAM|nr:hypothetical protein SCHPADRAFT_948034 [Schizopora paradoxa]